MHLIPGDAATVMVGDNVKNSTATAALRQELGLDQPYPQAYLAWLGNVARLDFGMSMVSGAPAMSQLAARGFLSAPSFCVSRADHHARRWHSAWHGVWPASRRQAGFRGATRVYRRAIHAGFLDRHLVDRRAVVTVALRRASDVRGALGEPARQSPDDAAAGAHARHSFLRGGVALHTFRIDRRDAAGLRAHRARQGSQLRRYLAVFHASAQRSRSPFSRFSGASSAACWVVR